MLVVFEGLDRAGKSTQVRLLADLLHAKGIPYRLYSYPLRKGTVTGPLINDYLTGAIDINPVSASFLLAANLYELKALIEEAVAAGEWVIFDRYTYSSIAYSVARGLAPEQCQQITARMPNPDVVFYLDADPRLLAARHDFGRERFDRVDFQMAVKQCFDSLERPDGWTVIDAAQEPAKIHGKIFEALRLCTHDH
jgi:dTMP kinase